MGRKATKWFAQASMPRLYFLINRHRHENKDMCGNSTRHGWLIAPRGKEIAPVHFKDNSLEAARRREIGVVVVWRPG